MTKTKILIKKNNLKYFKPQLIKYSLNVSRKPKRKQQKKSKQKAIKKTEKRQKPMSKTSTQQNTSRTGKSGSLTRKTQELTLTHINSQFQSAYLTSKKNTYQSLKRVNLSKAK